MTRIGAWLGLGMMAFGPACSAMSPAQRVQDLAGDYVEAIRFGRMDVAQAEVHRSAREAFARQHAAWHNSIRVLDCEVSGLRMKDGQHADVVISVSWQRIDESETRFTQIAQQWTSDRGPWLLAKEERSKGDVGLLGESVQMVAPSVGPLQFRTITIR